MKTAISTRFYGFCAVSGVALVASILITVSLSLRCSAQSDSAPQASEVSESVDNSEAAQSPLQVEDDFPPPKLIDDNDEDLPPETDLVTGAILKALQSPFHWGRISLLSATADEGYNSNPDYQLIPLGASVTSVSGLVAYSPRLTGWQVDFQYQPFIWISSRQTVKSFAAASANIRTAGRLGDGWRWRFADRLKYSPTHSTEQTPSFVVNPGGGFTIGNAFLSNGRNLLVDAAAATLIHQYSENSSLLFRERLDTIRVGSYLGKSSTDSVPVQGDLVSESEVIWRDHYSARNSVSLHYVSRVQTSWGASALDTRTNLLGVGWGRRLTPSLHFSTTAGPAWSRHASGNSVSGHGRTSLHASLGLSKDFAGGGMVLAFNRSDSFSGIISDTFHNRYDLGAHRQFTPRLSASVSASYVQQQFLGVRNAYGKAAFAETRYMLSRNWSIFGQARYLNTSGYQLIRGPQTTVTLGLRWFWVPDEP